MRTHFFRTNVLTTFPPILLATALCAQAQMPGAGGPAGISGAMAKIFGDIKAFSAKADVQVLDSSQKEMANMPMDFSFLDGKIRVEIDMAQMKNNNMPPGAVDQLKQMGMAQVVSIVRPDKKIAYVMYPQNKVLMTMPMPIDATDSDKEVKLQKTPLGKETIDGHACVKNKVLIPDTKGQHVEATTWNATDLKDFPIQIETKEKETTSIVHFTKVQFTKPEAAQFDPPGDYTQYNSPQEMMQGMMSKMTKGPGGAPGQKK